MFLHFCMLVGMCPTQLGELLLDRRASRKMGLVQILWELFVRPEALVAGVEAPQRGCHSLVQDKVARLAACVSRWLAAVIYLPCTCHLLYLAIADAGVLIGSWKEKQ